MKLFDKVLEKGKHIVERKKLLDENCHIPFAMDFPQERNGSILKYKYTNVTATLTGNTSGMKYGAIVYVNAYGIVENCADEKIGEIENQKLKDMLHDCFKKWNCGSTTAKFESVDDKLHITLAFYNDPNFTDDDDDEDDYDDYDI